MKNALTNQVGMLGDRFLWLVANLKQWPFGIYLVKQACGNDILTSVYMGYIPEGFWRISLTPATS